MADSQWIAELLFLHRRGGTRQQNRKVKAATSIADTVAYNLYDLQLNKNLLGRRVEGPIVFSFV